MEDDLVRRFREWANHGRRGLGNPDHPGKRVKPRELFHDATRLDQPASQIVLTCNRVQLERRWDWVTMFEQSLKGRM